MDITLEVFDTFIGDRLYASILPASLTSSANAFNELGNAFNATLSLFGNPDSYVYQPATQYFRLEPSKYVYLSAWPRDHICRQAISLYLITWFASRRELEGFIVHF
jgi:Delta7-sterol 5-desaturase